MMGQQYQQIHPLHSTDSESAAACRKIFEPFGGMKSAVIAARDNESGDTRLKLTGFNGDQMTSDPNYEAPLVKELELVLVVFDILYTKGQVKDASLITLMVQH